MAARGSVIRRLPPEVAVEAHAVLAALPDPVLVVDEHGTLRYANHAAEEFFDAGKTMLLGLPLPGLLPPDSPVFALIDSVRRTGASVSEYGVAVDMPRDRSADADRPGGADGRRIRSRYRDAAGPLDRRQDRSPADASQRRALGDRHGFDAGA